MKKWLTACLLAIALLFVATTAMAGHTKANGEYCLGGSYALLKEYENQHLLRCNDCQEEILENHWIGQEATCIRKAQCGGCTKRFGDYGPHGWGDWTSNGRGAHTRVCKHNDSHTETKDCTFSVAPCAEPAACTECGAVYSLDHDWGRWTSNGNKTHTHTCKRDSGHTETKSCDIREATCADPAWCRECYGEYGSADPNKHEWMFSRSNGDGTHTRFCVHSHTETRDCSGVSCGETGWCDECHGRYTASHRFDGPWSSNPDKHWRACSYCNKAGSRTPHSFVEQPDDRYLKSEATCVSPAVYYKVCSDCGYQTPSTFESGDTDPDNHDLERHDEVKAPTCTEKGWSSYDTCTRCDYISYQKVDALDHDWNDWTSNGNKTHTRACKRDPGHTETEACSGVRCGDTGACSVCKGEYTAADHKYEPWSHDADNHWRSCIYCDTEQIVSHSFAEYMHSEATCTSPAKYYRICSDCAYQIDPFDSGDIDPNNHDLIHHEAKAAACTEIGWNAYDTCSRCDHSTYEELTALGHDPIPHAAQAPTCIEPGWEAYDTCSRCDHTTYAELDALGHDPIPHAAQAPTCTEPGWEAYDTCSRCDYTTYAELDALDHDWSNYISNGDKTHTLACKNDPSHHLITLSCFGVSCGETGACTACGGEYTVAHQYISSWTSDGADAHWRDCILCKAGRETRPHSFKETPVSIANCVSPAKYSIRCWSCFYLRETVERGDIDPNNHDLVHHEAQAPTCTEIGWEAYDTCGREGCDYTTYAELAVLNHDLIHHAAKAPTCTEKGWNAYDTCRREGCDYTTYAELAALNHDLIHHAAQAPTCTETGWNAYDTCSRCDYTTYAELAAFEHDLIHHAAQAPSCTETGWNAYDTCSHCDYTTYAELAALNHDLIHHAAQAPTCTENGWNAYDTCGREGCGYTTYQELDALGHSYEARTVQPTCTKKGYTLHTCVRCKDRYTDAVVSSRGHWYGEWSPNGDATSSADCQRNGCKHTGKVPCEPLACRLLLRDAEAYDFTLCPVCGETGDGARLTLIEEARATAQRLPRGKLTLRIGDLQNGERVLSVGFEYGGKLTQPTGQMEITLPAALLDGYALMLLDADGAETALSHKLNGGEATFALDFAADESPALVLRLIPVS